MLVNAYCTVRETPELDFPHRLVSRRDRSDPELGPHLDGFAGFIMGGGAREMTPTRFHVLGHLGRVRHHLSLEVEDDDMDAFGDWARAANAVIFLPDATVRDPDGAVLVDPETGEPDEGAEVPHPADALERRSATFAELAKLGVKVPASLPPVVAAVEVVLREAAEVAARAQAVLAVAVRGESLATGDPLGREDIEAKLPGAFAALSPKERRFFATKKPTEQEVLDATWRYEALAVLAWALGLQGALPPATAIVDVAGLARTLFAKLPELGAKAKLRDAGEILDALDRHYRLHWAVRQARLDRKKPPLGLEPGVVAERHHALNWLVRFQDADWDEVDTPT